MLLCDHPSLTSIRIEANVRQAAIATKLIRESTSQLEQHLIEQFVLASWLSTSTTTARIWTGMWTKDTLTALLPVAHDMLSPLCKSDRHKFRRIVRLLTSPLIAAYKQMICIGISFAPPTNATRARPPISQRTQHHISLLIHQSSIAVRNNQLDHLFMSTNNSHTAFSYSDATFNLTDTEIGTRVNIT